MSNFFLLEEGAKVGVYGNGDTVYGTTGTQKALIMEGATNVNVLNTVEEIHLRGNMEDVRFTTDPNTLTVNIVVGGNTVASFTALESGMKLFTANGMTVIKPLVDTATGTISFTADNGATGATPVALPTDATALPADAIDASQTSENAGGVNPDPTPDPELPTYDLGLATDVARIPADGSAYNLIGTVQQISGAKNTHIAGATNITVKDNVTALTNEDAATNAVLNLVSSIVAEDKLELLALKDLSGLANPKLVVTSAPRSGATVDLRDAVTVAEADGAQAKLDAFLARTDVDYATYNQTQPTTLFIGKYAIKDDAVAVANATVTLLQRASDGVTVEDTVANIGKISADLFAEVDNVYVEDSLANISTANQKLLAEIQGKASTTPGTPTGAASFVATDTTEASMTVSGNFMTMFDGTTDEKTIDVSALVDKSTLKIDLLSGGFDISNNPFGTTLKEKVAVSITGSDSANTITLTGFKNDTVIDGNGGADTIKFGDGKDTLILGTGLTLPAKPADNASFLSKVTGEAFSPTDDSIQLSGTLFSFSSLETNTGDISKTTVSLAGKAGKVVYLSTELSDLSTFIDFDSSASKGLTGLEKNESALVVVSSANASKIYYVEERGGDGITTKDDIVVEIASFTDAKILDTNFDFA